MSQLFVYIFCLHVVCLQISVCRVLQEHGTEKDLLSNMTRVARKVAFDFQSNTPGDFAMHEKKQIPCITSMLTREVYFHRKV